MGPSAACWCGQCKTRRTAFVGRRQAADGGSGGGGSCKPSPNQYRALTELLGCSPNCATGCVPQKA